MSASIMSRTSMVEIAQNGSEEDFANLLKVAGQYVVQGTTNRWLDEIYKEMAGDKDKARRARKLSIITAYDAGGDKALEKVAGRPELETLKQLACESPSEKVAGLLKAQANDPGAVQAIIEGVQMDHKRRLRWANKKDKTRRREKKELLVEFYAKSGCFTPTEEDKAAAAAAQVRIDELEKRLAEMEKTATNRSAAAPVKPAVLKLQQP